MSNNCYLIICPDPSKSLQLQITGTAFAQTESSNVEPGDPITIHKPLHFVKFGDEKPNDEKRVKTYRTHNPSFWWRTIELGNATGVGDKKLGKYLEDKYLDGLGKPYGEHAEWHATEVGQAQLEKLCIDLDGKRDQNKPWWTSDFKDVDDLDKLFNHKFK